MFSNRVLPDGRRGLFHPDNFTFGQTRLSRARSTRRRMRFRASRRRRSSRSSARAPTTRPFSPMASLPLGRLEIARLDNEPNFPEHGVLRLDINGGK